MLYYLLLLIKSCIWQKKEIESLNGLIVIVDKLFMEKKTNLRPWFWGILSIIVFDDP